MNLQGENHEIAVVLRILEMLASHYFTQLFIVPCYELQHLTAVLNITEIPWAGKYGEDPHQRSRVRHLVDY